MFLKDEAVPALSCIGHLGHVFSEDILTSNTSCCMLRLGGLLAQTQVYLEDNQYETTSFGSPGERGKSLAAVLGYP